MAHEYQRGLRAGLEKVYAITQRDHIPEGCGVGFGIVAGFISSELEELGAQLPCSHGNALQLNIITQWCPNCGARGDKVGPVRWRWEYPRGPA